VSRLKKQALARHCSADIHRTRARRAGGAMPDLTAIDAVPHRARSRRATAGLLPILEVPGTSSEHDQASFAAQETNVMPAGEAGAIQQAVPVREMSPLAGVVSEIRETYRQRCDFHSAEKRLTLQIKGIGRRCGLPKGCTVEEVLGIAGGDSATLLIQMLETVTVPRKLVEKRLEDLAKTLPVWAEWAEATKGIGALGLGQIVGECGNLSDYANPAKLWKRMGLALIGGERQGPRANAKEALQHGYSPRRRSVMWNIGETIIKVGGPYRAVYDARKLYEQSRPACLKKFSEGKGMCEDKEVPGRCRPGHIHNRSRRYMEKRLLRDLWRAWRREPVE